MPLRESDASLTRCLRGLKALRQGETNPALFWPLFMDTILGAVNAEAGAVAVLARGSWQPIALRPEKQALSPSARDMLSRWAQAATACSVGEGVALLEADGRWLAALSLEAGVEGRSCLALVSLGSGPRAEAEEQLVTIGLFRDIPAVAQRARSAGELLVRQERLSSLLELLSRVNAQDRFLSTAMAFCNELAARMACDRVSLGWEKEGSVRLAALSHADQFDRKSIYVEKLELAMEECLDQDAEIVHPSSIQRTISKDHQALASVNGSGHAASFPLRFEGRPVGVCTVERRGGGFGEDEYRFVRAACDQTVRRLRERKIEDRWFGARWVEKGRPVLEDWVGPRHTWAKMGMVSAAFLLGFVCFIPVPYRVEGPVIVRSEDAISLSSAFDGFIEQVFVRPGDPVIAGQELMRLDRSDLFVEEAGLTAEANRYRRESEKARASGALADMRISESMAEQADARLAVVRHRLERAVIRTPRAGTVIEGDLRERLGAPVRQGDVLFRIGSTDRLEAEVSVREGDVHDMRVPSDGWAALAGRPGKKIRVRALCLEPSAVAKKEGNTFRVRCVFVGGIPSWAKPGMTGVGRLKAGYRTLLYVFFHRTLDFLRLRLWW